ncbi:hypothetical protein [Sphingomonas montanisoli]|uniref:Poly A polymerase head domain-containing protein n=1 Tax=Sphingomonas montanisoli TaxID=2606412 RepID=A0A5D9C3S6_9SPHN|nr:hypothetical protein [Sphingomonas montanisoli]TZG25620.1 hypothetical protein FYJ91_11380 [Sphingomonas montanisoli]
MNATQTLTSGDLQLVVSRIPRDVRKMMMEQPIFCGGGFIRETIAGNAVNDIDLFGGDKDLLKLSADYLASKREGAKVHTTDNAFTVLSVPRMPVQFITRWLFSEAEPLVRSFDFTVCQAAVWFDRRIHRWQSMIAGEFYPDLAARRLTYTSPVRDEEAGGSMLRVRKFLARGYNIQAFALAGVIARVALAAEVRGERNETNLTFAISRKLVEVDPLLLIDGFEPVNEHEVIDEEAAA